MTGFIEGLFAAAILVPVLFGVFILACAVVTGIVFLILFGATMLWTFIDDKLL